MEDDAAAESMNVFMVGIKGAGMSSLAVLLHSKGFAVSGSDSPEYLARELGSLPYPLSVQPDHSLFSVRSAISSADM